MTKPRPGARTYHRRGPAPPVFPEVLASAFRKGFRDQAMSPEERAALDAYIRDRIDRAIMAWLLRRPGA